jgi:hypothetical protein
MKTPISLLIAVLITALPAIGLNEISLIERGPNGLKVIEVYLGADKEKVKKSHLRWARLLKFPAPKRTERFMLFHLSPKGLDQKSKFVSDILRFLEIADDEDNVSGMIPVKKNQVELNGRIWLLEKKPRLAPKREQAEQDMGLDAG